MIRARATSGARDDSSEPFVVRCVGVIVASGIASERSRGNAPVAVPWRSTRDREQLDPRSLDLEWEATARASLPIRGTAADFAPEGDGRFFAGLDFEPGWWTEVVARDAKGEPIVGARVVVDGVAHGSTDADGALQLALERAPLRIELDAWGMRPLYAFPAVKSGHLADGRHEIVMTD